MSKLNEVWESYLWIQKLCLLFALAPAAHENNPPSQPEFEEMNLRNSTQWYINHNPAVTKTYWSQNGWVKNVSKCDQCCQLFWSHHSHDSSTWMQIRNKSLTKKTRPWLFRGPRYGIWPNQHLLCNAKTLDVFPCQSNQSSHLFMKIRKHCFYVCRTLLDKILHHLRCNINSVESELILHINYCNHWISEASAVLLVSFTNINPPKQLIFHRNLEILYECTKPWFYYNHPLKSPPPPLQKKNNQHFSYQSYRASSWAPLDAAAWTSTNPRPTSTARKRRSPTVSIAMIDKAGV